MTIFAQRLGAPLGSHAPFPSIRIHLGSSGLLRIGKESLPAADDDPDPSEPIGPEIVYAERICPGCGDHPYLDYPEIK